MDLCVILVFALKSSKDCYSREVAVSVGQVASVDVLRETRLLVSANGITLLAVNVLGSEVVRVNGAHNVEAVAVVGSHEDESLLEAIGAVEVGDGGLNGVVELKQFAKGAVVVEGVHHLINGRCFAPFRTKSAFIFH